jgi:hypothetical protein
MPTNPTFRQVLAMLMVEVSYGKAHFSVTRSLKGTHPAIVRTAPVFFDLSIGAHGSATILHAARIFDRKPGSASIHALLELALKHAGTFRQANGLEVRTIVADSKRTVAELQPIVDAIQTRRNESLAHTDPRAYVDLDSHVTAGRVSYRQLEGLFAKIEDMLNRLSELYDGRRIPLDLAGADDIVKILEIVLEKLRQDRRRGGSSH